MQKNELEKGCEPRNLESESTKKSPVSPKNSVLQSMGAPESEVFCSASCAVFKNHTFLKRDKRGEQTNFRALQTSLVKI